MVLLSENLTGRMAAWSCIELVIPGTDFWVELQGHTLVNKVTCKSQNPGYTLNSVNWLSQNFSFSVDFGSTRESWSHGELCHCWSVSPGYKQNSVTWMEAELWSLGKLNCSSSLWNSVLHFSMFNLPLRMTLGEKKWNHLWLWLKAKPRTCVSAIFFIV